MSNKPELKCRECRSCDVAESKCKITGRPVTLDSVRKCKLGSKAPLA